VGGDAGGSEAAFSSMASDRASGIRRHHSTKVVARLSFGRAAPTRAQLIPFVSRCSICDDDAACYDRREAGPRSQILGEAAPIHGRERSVDEERFNFEMAPPREVTSQRRLPPAARTD
jgi:hypothetical protein